MADVTVAQFAEVLKFRSTGCSSSSIKRGSKSTAQRT